MSQAHDAAAIRGRMPHATISTDELRWTGTIVTAASLHPDLTFSVEFVTAWPAGLTSWPTPLVVLQALNRAAAPDSRQD